MQQLAHRPNDIHVVTPFPFPRRNLRPSCATTSPSPSEGAGKTGYPLIPMVRVQQKSRRQNYRTIQISGLPCATVLTLIRALLGDRLDCPRFRDNAFHALRGQQPPGGRTTPLSPPW